MTSRDRPDRRPACIVCGSEELVDVVRIPSLPVLCNQLLDDPNKARKVGRADIDLVGCWSCGHLFNAAFDPAAVDYDTTYENSLMGSPSYRRYTEEVVQRLLSTYDLKGGSVVEIGCGRGEFLRMLCDAGMQHAVGFDPGRRGETLELCEAMLTIVGAPFDAACAPSADLICSRHVLEHLPRPVSLLESIRAAYSTNNPKAIYIEVPNGRYTVDRLGIWDLIYEHASYFTSSSLWQALNLAGFAIDTIEPVFGGQFLSAEARFRAAGTGVSPFVIARDVAEGFDVVSARIAEALRMWRCWLDGARRRCRRVAVWGGGAKTTTFLNLLDRSDAPAVAQVVDINPRKSGTFISGTAHPIGPPSRLREIRPDVILLMNPEYETEVRQLLQELRVTAELIAVSGCLPS